MGTIVNISTEVEPEQAWTDSGSIIYTSSDSGIAEILDTSGKKCAVLAKAPGKVTIKAALKGTKLTAECELTVKGIFTDDLLYELLNETGTLYFFEGVDKTLADIKLPANWSWTDASVLPLADDSLPIQLFQAVYTQEGYEPYFAAVPINVIKLEQIEIVGNDIVQNGEENSYQYICHYTGGDLPWDTVTQQWSLGQSMEFVDSAASDWEINIKANQDGRISLKVSIINPATQAAAELSASLAVRVCAIKVIPSESQPAYAVTDYTVTGAVVTIDAATQYDKNGHYKLALKASGADGTVHWTSSDTSVMTVDKNGLINIKTAGIATITASTDTARGELLIKVADYKPILDNKSVAVSIYASNPVPIGLIPQNGNDITEITINGAQNGTLTAYNYDGIWCLKASDYKAGRKEKVNLTVVTKNGTYKDIVLEVLVDVSRPDKNTIKIKQTVKPNVFYCGSEAMDAEFTVSSTKYDIVNIGSANNGDPYVVKYYNPVTGRLVLTPSDTSKSNMQRYGSNMTVTLTVKTAGLSEEFTIPLDVRTENKKPRLRLEDAVFAAGVKSSSVNLYNGKAVQYTGGIAFKVIKAPAGDTIAISASNGRAKIILDGSKNGTYTAQLSKNTWTSGLTVSGRVSKVYPKNMVLEAGTSRLTINTRKEYNEPVVISAAIRGNHDIKIEGLRAKPLKKGITATVKDNNVTISADQNITGTVKIELSGKVNGTQVKKAVLPVTLINKAPDIKLTAKGSINIADRSNTGIIYTASILNMPDSCSIESVKLVSAMVNGDGTNYSDCFIAALQGDKIELSAVPGKKLRANAKYTLKLDAVLDNSAVISKKVTVSLKNQLPKVAVKAVRKNLYKTNPDNIAVYNISAGSQYAISRVKLVKANDKDKNTEYFDVQYYDGKIYVALKNNSGKLKAGNYSLTCQVIIKDADNSKPVKVTLKVTVK